ncbi:Type I restriction-modification system, DNA-methyltransferase subunit M [Enhygromyxa salina]|uniref:Type I restriction-modification system, DNA-methyltransferase subunit M n=1 Tax=Enhygromyxa salina TaxID=215803 RepID=A0A0C2D3I8_9BACT|nr:hypothetical protein [Enhygromyxa salina]KIG17776.1 Type I restriction-modification system, DNA-methyltransferase subunit M [Enhygromyxa salina]
MARPSKRSALAVLTRSRLLELAGTFELPASTGDKKAVLIDTLAQSRTTPALEQILNELERTELEDICRAHGLDDAGRAKQPIIERILGREAKPELFGIFEEPDFQTGKPPTEPQPPTLHSVLELLRRPQLLALCEDFLVFVEADDDKPTITTALSTANGMVLFEILELLGDDDLRRVCVAHGLPDEGEREHLDMLRDVRDDVRRELDGFDNEAVWATLQKLRGEGERAESLRTPGVSALPWRARRGRRRATARRHGLLGATGQAHRAAAPARAGRARAAMGHGFVVGVPRPVAE